MHAAHQRPGLSPGHRRPGLSPESILAIAIGGVLIAYGLISLLSGGSDLGADFPDGTVAGETWLGIEANGWTNLLFMAAGVVLIAGSPRQAAAKAVALVVGLVLGAASVIAIADGNDVFGIFAANGGTMALWGFAAVALLVIAFMPRRSDNGDESQWTVRDDESSARFSRPPAETQTVDRTPADRIRR